MRCWPGWKNLCCGAVLAATLAACGTSSSADRFQALADAIESERQVLGVPGVAAAVIEGGKVTFARGFGTRDPNGNAPVTPSTLFRIGSCTKALTAIALLQQVQQGKVSLDAPLVSYVPGFHLDGGAPSWASSITVRQLLDHTSGISDYGELDAPADEGDDGALERFLTGRFAGIGYVQYPPGALYSYSNPNYMLAGLVAEKVSGVPYRDLMRTAVLRPLGMERTLFSPAEVVADGDYAIGRTCSTGEVGAACSSPATVAPDAYDNPWGRPAGWAWSSVLDLAKLAAFLVHGADGVLASDLRSAMLTSQVSTHLAGDVIGYGFGMMVGQGFFLGPPETFYRAKMLSHGGAISGFTASIACVPDLDFCFITLANGDAGAFQRSLVTALSTLAHLPPPSAAPDIAPNSARYSAYAGDYADAHVVGAVHVSAAGGKLSISVPTLDQAGTVYAHELTPTTLDNFTMQVNGETWALTFLTDEGGVYRYLRGDRLVAVRTP